MILGMWIDLTCLKCHARIRALVVFWQIISSISWQWWWWGQCSEWPGHGQLNLTTGSQAVLSGSGTLLFMPLTQCPTMHCGKSFSLLVSLWNSSSHPHTLYWHMHIHTTIGLNTSLTEEFTVKSGVNQGCVLAPSLFSGVTDHLKLWLTSWCYIGIKLDSDIWRLILTIKWLCHIHFPCWWTTTRF